MYFGGAPSSFGGPSSYGAPVYGQPSYGYGQQPPYGYGQPSYGQPAYSPSRAPVSSAGGIQTRYAPRLESYSRPQYGGYPQPAFHAPQYEPRYEPRYESRPEPRYDSRYDDRDLRSYLPEEYWRDPRYHDREYFNDRYYRDEEKRPSTTSRAAAVSRDGGMATRAVSGGAGVEPFPRSGGRKKRAVLVGCNYPGSEAALSGCVNDVTEVEKLLRNSYGFQDIRVLIDTDPSYPSPTGHNIKQALLDMVSNTNKGDVLVFHFSGHGSQIPSDGDDYEEDGLDEVIVPTDMDVIVDDDLRAIVEKIPDGVNFTFIADCCHSGSMLDHDQVVLSGDKGGSGNAATTDRSIKSRFLDMDTLHKLADKVGTGWKNILDQSNHMHPTGSKLPDDKGILITGCQAHETSADAFSRERNQHQGAMSNALLEVAAQLGPNASYRDLVVGIRSLLAQQRHTQNPCLECSQTNADRAFLAPF